MKKLILLILFLPFLQAKAQTSVYHPFPDSNAVWNFHYSINCPVGGWPIPEADFSIIISGDTTINGILYKKLYTPFVSAGPNPNNCPLPDTGYHGAIRQDTSAKKVFVFLNGANSEELYFDFTLSANDTIFGFLNPFFILVQSTDSILIGNSYRKRWVLDTWLDAYVIEGIGFNYGLVHSTGLIDGPGYHLTCFKQDNQTLYPDTTTTCDLITVSVPDVENELQDFKIFPNPAFDEINISFKLEKSTNVEFQLYNSLGQKIKVFSEEKLKAGENQIKLSLEDIPEGVYYLKICTNENEITRKIIKY